MVKEYEKTEIFNNIKNNPFCSEGVIGLFGMIAKIRKDTIKLERKLSKNTYVWIEKFTE